MSGRVVAVDGRRRAARFGAARGESAARLSGGPAGARRVFYDGRRRYGSGGCFVNLPRLAPRGGVGRETARAGRRRGRRRRLLRPRHAAAADVLPVNPSFGSLYFPTNLGLVADTPRDASILSALDVK